MNADFSNVDCTSTKIVGVYPCCQKKVLHFDPCFETSVSLKCGSRINVNFHLLSNNSWFKLVFTSISNN